MKKALLFLLFVSMCTFKTNAQCNWNSNFNSLPVVRLIRLNDNIDTVTIYGYSISENGEKILNSEKTYAPLINSTLGSYTEISHSYGSQSETMTTCTYDKHGRISSTEVSNPDYGVLSEDHYYYNSNGCDSLVEYTTYNVYGTDGGDIKRTKRIIIDGLTRTEISSNAEGTYDKSIYIYNEQGKIIKHIQYFTREATLASDAKPWLITLYYYDENGNNYKRENLNALEQLIDIYVYTFDEHGNVLMELGKPVSADEDPLAFAEELLEYMRANANGMHTQYIYDEKGNVIEAKWRYNSSTHFGNMFAFKYSFKN